MKRLILIGLLLAPQTAWSAVAFLNSNTGVVVAGGSYSASLSVTAGGSNKAAFAPVCFDGGTGAAITAVTYGGQAMTSAGTASANTVSTVMSCGWYYLVNPPTGANTLAITASGSPSEIYSNIVSFTGVDQATPVRAGTYQGPANPHSTAGAYTMTVTSNASDISVTTMTDGVGSTSSNQTQDTANTGGNLEQYSDHATTPASSVAHTWTTGGTEIAISGLSIQAASGGSSSTCAPPFCGLISMNGSGSTLSTKGSGGSIKFR